jgi:LEA14-like dessication related protein
VSGVVTTIGDLFVEREVSLVETELTRRKLGYVAAAVLGLLVVLSVGVAVAFDAPRTVSSQSDFTGVDDETATVDSRIVVQNPNDVAVPGGVDLSYVVRLNEVRVARGNEPGVELPPGNTTIETEATFDNSKIPAWWVSHVNGNESSVMTTTADVGVAGTPLGPTLTVERREVETDLLGPLAQDEPTVMALNDTEILRLENQTGRWAEADADRSPLVVENEVENVHERPVEIAGTVYEIRMNDVVVGEGETTEGIRLDPGESATYDVEAAIDTPTMQQWWVSHLRNGETTNLTIDVHAVAEVDGDRQRLPLAVYERQAVFETDLLETGESTVRVVGNESAGEEGFARPTVEDTESEFGEVRDDETEIRTTATVDNPSGDTYTDSLSVDVRTRTTLAGVVAANGSDRVEDVPQGTGTVTTTATMAHDRVPTWWAAHLRNGERSESRTGIDADADVGITKLPIDGRNRSSTVRTDTLADLNDASTRAVRSEERGTRVLTVHSTSAEYTGVSASQATIVVRADLENENRFSSVTIRDVDYTVTLNDVTLAERTASEVHTLEPGERRSVEFTLVLNNSKMAAWWPTHVRNGQVSELDRTATATVETDGDTERVDFGFLSGNQTVETDVLSD